MSRHRFTIDVEVDETGVQGPTSAPDEWDGYSLLEAVKSGRIDALEIVAYEELTSEGH